MGPFSGRFRAKPKRTETNVRTYYVNEVLPEDVQRLKQHLEQNGHGSPIEDVYWFEVPQELLSETQQEHAGECGPFVFPLETGSTWLMLELLIRPRNSFHCSCIAYASAGQRAHVIQRLEAILEELEIRS
jgi:hypothetical protein